MAIREANCFRRAEIQSLLSWVDEDYPLPNLEEGQQRTLYDPMSPIFG